MIGNGYPAETFRRADSRPEAARFARAEFRDSGTAWLVRDAHAVAGKRAFSGFGRAWRGFRAAAARLSAMLF